MKKQSKQKQPDFNFIEKLVIPPSIQDPDLLLVCRSNAKMAVELTTTYALTTIACFYFNLPRTGFVGVIYCSNILISLLILKLGFTQLFRYWFMVGSLIGMIGISVNLGVESFFWVWYLIAAANTFFIVLDREKYLKIFGFGALALTAFINLLIFVFKIIPPEVKPEYRDYVIDYGIFTVILATSSLFSLVIRYQRDVTLYKNRLETQSLTMLQQAKMSTLGEMAAGVAHEINNPLGIIIGKIQIWKSRFEQNQIDMSKVVSDFGKIETVAQRIAKIVSSLRTFSRNAENDPFEAKKLVTLIDETLSFCAENFKIHGVEIKITGEQNFYIQCRPTQISQVLINMLNNAFDAIKNLPEKWIEIKIEKLGEQARLSITDSGKGIPKDIAEKIMNPFFTTKEIGQGTGLGLSISKGIIDDHGGTLSLDQSCPNTRFVIELPAQTGEQLNQTA